MHITNPFFFVLPLSLLPGALSGSPRPFHDNPPPSAAYTYPPLEQIRYTLALETFLLDAKNWTALDVIYAHDAVANFTSLGVGVWSGRTQIVANEQKALGAVTHGIHQISSSAILIKPGNASEAHVSSYYSFNRLDTDADGSERVLQTWVRYEDQWVDTRSYDGSPSSWRVKDRQVVLVGGSVAGYLNI